MPTLNLFTNVPASRVTDVTKSIKRLSQTVAQKVGKPERYVMVSISTDKPMLYAGTDEPCAWAELISIGAIGGAKNKQISAALCQVVEEEFSVPQDRFYIKFSDVNGADHGYNGSTF